MEQQKVFKEFQNLIATADRIVIRDGGFDCCGPVDGQKILLEMTDPKEIQVFNHNLNFEGTTHPCKCCGYPGIDWYKEKVRLALTAVHHDAALRWKGSPGDAKFTKESSQWLSQWLLNHKIPPFGAASREQTIWYDLNRKEFEKRAKGNIDS